MELATENSDGASDPDVPALKRSVVALWRGLTGGSGRTDARRRTLIAFSGGTDSTALLLCLAPHAEHVVAAHVVHDHRPIEEGLRDLEHARTVCRTVGVELVEGHVRARPEGGNYEAAARVRRLEVLASLAQERGCRFVATGHQAQDQVETLLMRLARGSGPAGLRGIRPRRRLVPGVDLVRPMLGLSRAQTRAIVVDSRLKWIEDPTNEDPAQIRAALRRRVVPELLALLPGVATRSVERSQFWGEIDRHLRRQARELIVSAQCGEGWSRDLLTRADPAVRWTALRRLISDAGAVRDAVAFRTVREIDRALTDARGHPRQWTLAGVVVALDAELLKIRRIG